jgi:hypothetical protein
LLSADNLFIISLCPPRPQRVQYHYWVRFAVLPATGEKTMTRHLWRVIALLVLAFFVLPAPADDDKKADEKKDAKADVKKDDKDAKPDAKKDDKDKKGDDAKKDDAKKDDKDAKPDAKKEIDKKEAKETERKYKDGVLRGTIKNVDETKRQLRLELAIPITKLNEGEARALVQEQANLQTAILKRDANGIANANNAIAQHQARLYSIETKKVDIQVTTVEDLKVRLARPPVQFDEKGKVKKYTKKELDDLKGPDTKLPGYMAEFSDLHADQIVEVYLKKKDASKGAKPTGKKDKDADTDLLAHVLPEVSMVVILVDNNTK